ncbi:MAG: hypothetical protein K2L46_03680 [Paramuribaculum sp.]|nr:hypothetical protein [Paramuribaculum sp.]MDE6488357.1 hypothetical protein [Paramuribaculum sp.]
MTTDNSTQTRLKQLSGLYFEGLTTLEEEAELRQLVADQDLSGTEADAVRAVMSFAACSEMRRPRAAAKKSHVILRLTTRVAVAASVAVVALFWQPQRSDRPSFDDCYAYVDGHLVDNPDKVMALVSAELEALGEASETIEEDIENDLSLFSSAMQTQPTQETESL